MITLREAIQREDVPQKIRELLHIIPVGRRESLFYLGTYVCDKSGKGAVILKDEKSFIVCRSGNGTSCAESPSIFAALEEVYLCQCLWRV